MLKNLELSGFKSFNKKSTLEFDGSIMAIVGPNGSGKSNVVEAIRFVLGEQSMKSMRGKSGTDLIFKGSKNLPKRNQASVSIYFDNAKRIFNLDFDEISITREVYGDGVNRYLVNGSEVRLKDIIEMLSSVNIGSSSHHIISQGEADRILNAGLKERRMMIEDALGLKIYQYRIRESERKIEKTRENMKEVGLLRKEIAPHLQFLKKQVEKVEKAKEMRGELSTLYDEYLKREETYINAQKIKISSGKKELEEKISEIDQKLTERMLELEENKFKISGKCPLCGNKIEKWRNKEELDEFKDVKKLEFQMEKNKLLSNLNLIKIEEDQLVRIENDFINEIKEGSVLLGSQIMNYKNFVIELVEKARSLQEERRKKIERVKIRLEDIGTGGGGDLIKEYEETSARDQFLAREIEDLSKSILSLEELNKELKQKLEVNFKDGIEKINKQFQEFFILMFGGGSASLAITSEEKIRREKVGPLESPRSDLEEPEDEEEIEKEQGIEINVSLPRKKVKELNALSGGERSLASIALLFAMSQVNPPPFLVLDETDAALDEANSRKYGDMIEKLSKYSQLILVTHNRETMSRAGVLYGITIGQGGVSKLLSIKFDEAVTIAK